MILESNQICPYSTNCKYHGTIAGFCQGTNPSRNNTFECNYVNNKGKIIDEGRLRSIHDITGKMEFISETGRK